MAKGQGYFVPPHRKLTALLENLTQNELQHTSKQLKDILAQKKAKLREMYSLSSHELLQPPLLPTAPAYPHFSASIPINVQQKFISEKIKANVLTPDRFYSVEPNMKAGSFLLPKRSEETDPAVVQGKFREFDRVLDEQSGEVKQRKLVKLASLHSESLEPARYKYRRMKQTLFHKFLPDKYNFYLPPNASLKKSATFEPTLKRSLSKYVASEDNRTIDQRSELPSSSRDLRTVDPPQPLERRSSILNKSRGKPTAPQKDINSLA